MSAPVLEPRSAEELAASLRARIPAFVPGWQAPPGGPAAALLLIYGQFLRALAERIDAAPDKNELAFLDMLGLDVLPAGAARAPVVFSTLPGAGNGRAPARTRLGAKGSDPATQIVFETERPVGLAEAQLAEVVSLWPGLDEYADHSADAIGGRPFNLWTALQPVPHELYIAHDLHFALDGQATVSLQFELARGARAPVELEWSWWDGEAWRALSRLSFDGTGGLSRSGTIRLVTDCAASRQRTVGGWNAHWLRGRVVQSLPPDPARTLAQVDRIEIRTVLGRALGAKCSGGLLPDAAFADGQAVDFSKPAKALGARPGPGSALYLACAEAFSRPDATVTICVRKATTQEEEADAKLLPYELDVNKARRLLKAARIAADKTKAALDGLNDAELRIDNLPSLWAPGEPDQWYQGIRQAVILARTKVVTAVEAAVQACILTASPAFPPHIPAPGDVQYPHDVLAALVEVTKDLSVQPTPGALTMAAQALTSRALGLKPFNPNPADVRQRLDALPQDYQTFVGAVGDIFLPAQLPSVFKDAQDHFNALKDRITRARMSLAGAITEIGYVIDNLKLLSPMSAAAASGFLPPTLANAVLAWEYWDGGDWSPLIVTATGNAPSFRASGSFTFSVPDNWSSSTVNGVDALWARARLQSGSYAKLRLVSWTDQQSEAINFLPIIEPRPPVLDALRIGYDWASKPAVPQRCLTLNDFRWEDHTEDAAWRGEAFEPFRPVADVTPALYLGFDRPLPADELGILLDLQLAETPDAPGLEWERWDGSAWHRVTATDETERLTVPGIVSVLWPGDRALEPQTVVSAVGQEVVLSDARAAARFTDRDVVWLEADGKGELATVEAVDGQTVAVAAPLSGTYGQATLVQARLPRFGTPRTWLRARLREDGDPLRARVNGIHPNAVWSAQIETVEDELLGSGNGEPRQVFFLTRTPVLANDEIEVRELDGQRAHIEFPLLVDELRARGIREVELRVVRDSQTGQVREVWVPWRRRQTLAFSAPGDRHYTLERTRGRVLFGDGAYGLVLPVGPDNVRARRYRSGGGEKGNVPAGAIDQVLSGALVAGVTNPLRAEGGADTESDASVLARGPLTVRHRRQALTTADYEALAREASPGVAVAWASAWRGGVSVAIVPHSHDPQPEPSWELRREVRDFLRARAPAALARAVSVVPPSYAPVGVSVVLAPRSPEVAGPLVAAATDALRRFLHPLTGGPAGAGWPLGRAVHASDVAALLEGLEDVDYVDNLILLVGGAPQGETVAVGRDRLVAAGRIDVELVGAT